MTQDERAIYWESWTVLDDLINRTPRTTAKTGEHVSAFSVALLAMHRFNASERNIHILLYHVENPPAYLFRDAFTLAALREAQKCVFSVLEQGRKEDGN